MSSSTSRFLFDKDVPARIGDNSKRDISVCNLDMREGSMYPAFPLSANIARPL